MKVKIAGMCLFLVLFVCLFVYILHLLIISRFYICEHESNVLVFACRCCIHDGDGTGK